MIKDCFGIEARVGDEIAFSQGSAGSKVWEHAEITKITPRCVYFRGRAGGMYRQSHSDTDLRRGPGSFVINQGARKDV